MKCTYCGGPNTSERVTEMGYSHCTRTPCVAAWRRQRNDEAGLVLATRHKQGPAWMYASDLPSNSMRRTNGV